MKIDTGEFSKASLIGWSLILLSIFTLFGFCVYLLVLLVMWGFQ